MRPIKGVPCRQTRLCTDFAPIPTRPDGGTGPPPDGALALIVNSLARCQPSIGMRPSNVKGMFPRSRSKCLTAGFAARGHGGRGLLQPAPSPSAVTDQPILCARRRQATGPECGTDSADTAKPSVVATGAMGTCARPGIVLKQFLEVRARLRTVRIGPEATGRSVLACKLASGLRWAGSRSPGRWRSRIGNGPSSQRTCP